MKKIINFLLCATLFCFMFAVVPMAYAESKVAPQWIDIVWGDNSYQEVELSNGLKDKSYPVPKCVAVDNYGNEINNVQVYVYAPDNSIVPIVGGRFDTVQTGEYKIYYEVEYYNLTADKTIFVTVVDDCEELLYDVNEKIQTNVKTGTIVTLYNGVVSGGLGFVNIDYSLTFNDENVEIEDFGGSKFFKPTKAGEYVLKYTLTDFVKNQKIENLTITVEDSNSPLLEEVPVLRLNKVDDIVNLPVASAVLYHNGSSYSVPVKVYYDDLEITDTMSYVATVGEHKIKYVAQNVFNSNYKAERVYDVNVVNHKDWTSYVNYLDNFIYTQNCSASYVNGEFTVVANEEKDDALFYFSRPIHNSLIQLDFNTILGSSNFESIMLTYTDSVNKSEKLEIIFTRSTDGKTDVYLNGNLSAKIDYFFDKENTVLKSIPVKINCTTNELVNFSDEAICKIPAYENGTEFLGFSSGKVIMEIKMLGVTGSSAIKINSIASFTLVEDGGIDNNNPARISNEKFSSLIRAEINQTVTVPYIEFYDLFDENVTLNVRINDPTGKSVYDGIMTEDYQFTVTTYGNYSVTYVSTDSSGNGALVYSTIEVSDRVAPTIKVDKIKKNYKVGDKITLPKPSISDNVTEKCSSYVYIVGKEYECKYIYDYEYTFNVAGNFIIRYVAVDEAHNVTVLEFYVTCK